MTNGDKVLITGGTGMQGKPTVLGALARGLSVRVMVRDTSNANAKEVEAAGAELVTGSFEDQASLDAALEGVRGVFSLQLANPQNGMAQMEALLAAAKRAGVEQFVQSTVSSTGLHESFVDWENGRWDQWYWLDKERQERTVREAGFKYWTMIRPALLMDNFLPYRAAFMHPELLTTGEIISAAYGDTPIAFISSENVGEAGAAALADPERYNRMELELADEMISFKQVAEVLTEVTGKPVRFVYETIDQAKARGVHPGVTSAQDWNNAVGYAARPEMLREYGLTPISFREWARKHSTEFEVGGA